MNKLQVSLAIGLIISSLGIGSPVALFAQFESSENSSSKEPLHDPFKVLIQPRKTIVEPAPIPPDRPNFNLPKPVPALVINVTAIAGKPSKYVGIIKYEGNAYIVEEGFEPADRSFKVRKIYEDRIEVFYSRDKSIKTFLF
jgi:hypothetical protein